MIRARAVWHGARRGGCPFALGVLLTMFYSTEALATNHVVQADEVCGGINGNSQAQYIEIKSLLGQNRWGPQGLETESRAMLTFSDSTGALVGTFEFPSDPPQIPGTQDPQTPNHFSALIATAEAAALPGFPTPDFTINRLIIPQAGKVCFKNNPNNPNAFFVTICVSYGDNVNPDFNIGRLPFVGDTEGAGPPAPALPTTTTAAQINVQSLKRVSGFGCTGDFCHTNADFDIGDMDPRNSQGQTLTIPADPLADQGLPLFAREAFEGNSRNCASCHKVSDVVGAPVLTRNEAGGISPQMIQDLFAVDPLDPLFIAENDPALAGLELPCLMRTGDGGNAGTNRGLILENICGFGVLPFFREPVHIINVKFSGPFGHNDQVPNLQEFSRGAVQQHFPKFIGPGNPRNFDPSAGPIAARIPNEAEVVAMEAFMNSVRLPSDLPDSFSIGQRDAEIDRMVAASVECRGANQVQVDTGRSLFFGTAKCFFCHVNQVLAGPTFDTGVVDLAVNQDDGCNVPPSDPQDALNFDGDCAGGRGFFAAPPLFGIALTAPFMHANERGLDEDNPTAALHDAVNFYNSNEFNNSNGGIGVGGISLTAAEVDAITAFLEALQEPIECGGACCLPDGTCLDDVNQSVCEAQCGNFRGANTTCASGPICPIHITGACCKPDNSCEETNGQCACELTPGGEYSGDGTNCASTTCDMPGACCLPDATCQVILESECLSQCGVFDGENTVCGTECCVELPQACCLPDGTCQDLIECVCLSRGGIPQGPDTNCSSADVCPQPGACCLPGPACELRLQTDCEADCGVFLGEGVSCPPPIYCPIDPPKACCLPDDSCIVTDPCLCEQQGGTAQTADTCPFAGSCVAPPSTGACCMLDGTCDNITQAECNSACGVWNGDGSDCLSSPIACSVPRACCLRNGVCIDTNACDCAARGGVLESGFTVTCATKVCPGPKEPDPIIQVE